MRTATSATATTQAARPYPLTIQARTPQHIRYTAPAPERYAMLGESILRHLVSAGCCMPFRCRVSTMLTLAPVRSAWQRQSAHGHPRLMSQMVTAGREVRARFGLYAGCRRSALLPVPHRTGGSVPDRCGRGAAAAGCRAGAVAPGLLIIAGTGLPAAMLPEGVRNVTRGATGLELLRC
jgi:hypothetical protein